MNHFEINWSDFLAAVGQWQKVPLSARNAYLQQPHNIETWPAEKFQNDLIALVRAGLLVHTPQGDGVKLPDDLRPFHRVLRSMSRHPIFRKPEAQTLRQYLNDHFTREEHHALADSSYQVMGGGSLFETIRSITWVRHFLEIDDPKDTSYELLLKGMFVRFPFRLKGAQFLLRKLMARPEPVSFQDLRALCPDTERYRLGEVVMVCLRLGLVFPGLREEDQEPILGLWPEISRRIHKPHASSPPPVNPISEGQTAFLMEDVFQVLFAALAEPLRLRRSDEQIMAKVEEKIAANLLTLPEWIEQTFRTDPGFRIRMALAVNLKMGFAVVEELRGKGPFLKITPAGTDWIDRSEKDRLKILLDRIRKSADKQTNYFSSDPLTYLPFFYGLMDYERFFSDLPRWISEAFKTLPENQFVRLKDFLDFHGERANPLPEAQKINKAEPVLGLNRRFSPETLEKAWRDILFNFFFQRLLPLGGVRLGLLEKQEVCFALTSVGRYLLADVKDFDYGDNGLGQVIVQPNFEITFLAPCPHAETRLIRFAQRTGRRIGVLFKITKPSILAASAAGLSADDILQSLRQIVCKPLPDNVVHEIHAWFAQTRRITLKAAYVIRCPDPETAAKVLALGKAHIKPITSTVLELTTLKFKPIFLKKLREKGIFIGEGPNS